MTYGLKGVNFSCCTVIYANIKTASLDGTECQRKKFDELLGIVGNALQKKCIQFREPISPEEQLVIMIT